jgi:GxxExxY protein
MREPAGDFCNQARHYLRQSKQLPGITVCSPGVMPSEFDDPQTYKIIGAAMAVHRELGCGFLEAVSREALTIELREREVPFVREARLPVHYRDRLLPLFYTVDFICYDEVLVELKALRAIGPVEEAQLINYLRVARRSRRLVLNFGATSLQHRRLVLNLANDPADHSGRV